MLEGMASTALEQQRPNPSIQQSRSGMSSASAASERHSGSRSELSRARSRHGDLDEHGAGRPSSTFGLLQSASNAGGSVSNSSSSSKRNSFGEMRTAAAAPHDGMDYTQYGGSEQQWAAGATETNPQLQQHQQQQQHHHHQEGRILSSSHSGKKNYRRGTRDRMGSDDAWNEVGAAPTVDGDGAVDGVIGAEKLSRSSSTPKRSTSPPVSRRQSVPHQTSSSSSSLSTSADRASLKRRSRGKTGASHTTKSNSRSGGSGGNSVGSPGDRSSSPTTDNPRPTSTGRLSGDHVSATAPAVRRGVEQTTATASSAAADAAAASVGALTLTDSAAELTRQRVSRRSSGGRGNGAGAGGTGSSSSGSGNDSSSNMSRGPASSTAGLAINAEDDPVSSDGENVATASATNDSGNNNGGSGNSSRDPTLRGPHHASPISRAAAAAARGGGTLSSSAEANSNSSSRYNAGNTVQLVSHTRSLDGRGRRGRPPQAMNMTEGSHGGLGDGSHRRSSTGTRGGASTGGHKQDRHSNNNSGGGAGPTGDRGGQEQQQQQQQRPRNAGVHGSRVDRRERVSRGAGGHGRRRGGGSKALPRGRPAGRSGRRGRRSVSMPQSYRGPGAFGLAPVVEEDAEGEQEHGEEEEEETTEDDQELVFKIINKDSGEVVGDIRDEQHRDIPFDVLPRGFRPAEAWHPELQEHAASAAASPLDLAGTELAMGPGDSSEPKAVSSKTSGSRFKFYIRRGLKGREHHHKDDDGGGLFTGHHGVSGGGAAGGSGGGGKDRGVTGFAAPTAVSKGPVAAHAVKERDRERSRSTEGATAEAAIAAAATVSWPKNSGRGEGVPGHGAGAGDVSGVGEASTIDKRASLGSALEGTLSNKASVLLGLQSDVGDKPAPARRGSGNKVALAGALAGVLGAGGKAAAGAGGVDGGTSPPASGSGGGGAGAGERGASPPPSAPGAPRSSPGSGERGPTRQEMAAAQVAKRKEALRQGRGLMENAFLKGVAVGGAGLGGGMAAAVAAAAAAASGGGVGLLAPSHPVTEGNKPPPVRVSTGDDIGAAGLGYGVDGMDESPKGTMASGVPASMTSASSQSHAVRSGAELQLSPGFQALAAAAVGLVGGHSPTSKFTSIMSPKSGTAQTAAISETMAAVKGMKLLQHFRAHAGPVWCAEFSRKGQYLATGGADGLVKIWHIGASEDSAGAPPSRDISKVKGLTAASLSSANPKALQRSGSNDSIASMASVVSIATTACGSSFDSHHRSAPVVPPGELVIGGRASRVLRGHNGDVVDLSWSPNASLLSAGRDGSLRLWHPGRLGCVHLFPQTGAATPTSCAFHPRSDNSFATAGEDGKLRVWKITSAMVEAEAQMPNRTTHVRFSPDGKVLAAGMLGGQVRFLTSDSLQPLAQVDLRNRKGASGVSSITFKPGAASKGEVLISGANSRLRLFRIEPLAAGTSAISAAVALARRYGYGDRGSSVVTRGAKLKGHLNPALPVRSSVSEDGALAVCGSEDGMIHVWDARPDAEAPGGPRAHVSFEGITPLPKTANSEFSLSPGASEAGALLARSGSLAIPTSLSPSPRAGARAGGGMNGGGGGVTSPDLDGDGNRTSPSGSTATVPLFSGSHASRSGVGDHTAKLSPDAGAVSSGRKDSRDRGKDGRSRRRRSPFSKSPTERSPVGRARGGSGSGSGSKRETAGSGAAVTLTIFVPKAAMARFEEANGLASNNTAHPPNQALRHQRTASKTNQARRRAEIPSIAEVVHADERPAGPFPPWETHGAGDRGSGNGERHDRGSGDRERIPAESLGGNPADRRLGRRGGVTQAGKTPSKRSPIVVQRRGSTSDVVVVDDDSVSPPPGRDRRKAKKARGASGTGGGHGGNARPTRGRRSRSHSPLGTGDDDPPPPPPPPLPHQPSQGRQGPSSVPPSSAPPSYVDQTPDDALASSAAPMEQHPSPPPYDPNARWGWEEDGSGSRRTNHARVRGEKDADDAGAGGAGAGATAAVVPVGTHGEATEQGITSFADGAGRAGANRVVTVDVYRPPDQSTSTSTSAGTPGAMRGRDLQERRSSNNNSGHAKHSGLRLTRRSTGPLIAIVMSSPSASPSPAPLCPPSPGFGDDRAGGWAGRDDEGQDKGERKSEEERPSNSWAWDSAADPNSDNGSATTSATAPPALWRAPLASNSLMVATDSLGNVRVYAKDSLLETLNMSAFSAPR